MIKVYIYKNILMFLYIAVIRELLLVVEMFLHVCLESLFFLIQKNHTNPGPLISQQLLGAQEYCRCYGLQMSNLDID